MDLHIGRSCAPSAHICQRFLADHARLESLLEGLLAAFEANDREDMAKLWTAFEAGLNAHLDAEERYLIPAFERDYPEEARVILAEHEHIRSRLIELGTQLDLHIVRLTATRAFIDELRAHAANEDRLLYQWSDTHFKDDNRAPILEALVTPSH